MKFKLNRAFREASGELDGLVYRVQRGKVVAARKPDTSKSVYSEIQLAHRARFKQATMYGKSVMANPTVRALYEEEAERRNIPVFAVTVADFFHAPKINSIDVSGYNGQPGSAITVKALDDFGVISVQVSILDDQGNTLEHGGAEEIGSDSGIWVYTATATLPAGNNVTVRAVASDRPGGTAVETQSVQF